MLRITALMDNKAGRKDLIAEHGLALYAEYNGRRILFDCGSGPNFQHNAHRLGISLGSLDAVILSHSHYDHAAGFRDLTEAGLGSGQVCTGPHFFEPKFSRSGVRCTDLSPGFDREFLDGHTIRHQQVTGLSVLFPGVYLLTGFPRIHDFEQIPGRFVRRVGNRFLADDFPDELCMAMEVDGGLAVLVGCSHPGILNMLCHVRTVLGKPIKAVFGGTHLVEADAERIEATIARLKDMGLEILGLSHCSGEAAEQIIRTLSDIRGCHLGVGDSIFLD